MDPYSLSAISADTESGIKTVIKRVTIVLTTSKDVTIKENLIKHLNLNINKYSPDIGGLLLGYTNVKYSKVNFDWSRGDTDEIVTLDVKAKFFLFSPCVGSILRCSVKTRSPGKINCVAQSHFPVTVYNPGASWDSVGSGDVVMVEVKVVSQMANTNPVIIGIIKYNGSIIQDVINLDDIETEEDVGNEITPAASPDEMSTVSSVESSHTSSKKRKHDEEQSSSNLGSPVKKKSKVDIQESLSDDRMSSTSGITNTSNLPKPASQTKKPLVPPKSPSIKIQKSKNDSDPYSPSLISKDPMAGKTDVDSSNKILPKILPRPKSSSSESPSIIEEAEGIPENKSEDEDEKSKSSGSTRRVFEDASSSRSVPGETGKVPVQKSKIPDGFKDISVPKSRTKKIQAPNGKIFNSFKSCWDYVNKNPDYLNETTNIEKFVNEKNLKAGSKEDKSVKGVNKVLKSQLTNKNAEELPSGKKQFGEESESDSSFEGEPVKIPANNKKSSSSKETSSFSNGSSTSSSEDESDAKKVSQKEIVSVSSSKDKMKKSESKKKQDVNVSPTKVDKGRTKKNAVFQSSSESESDSEVVQKDQKRDTLKPTNVQLKVNGKVEEYGRKVESSFEDDSDSDTGFEDDKKGKKKSPEKKKIERSSSSDSDSDSDDESSDDDEEMKEKKSKSKGKVEKKEVEEPVSPRKNQSHSEVNSSPALVTNYKSKTPKKVEEKALGARENLFDKVLSKNTVESPHLSSTVSCDKGGENKVKVPEGISPILKKTKSISSKADKSVGGYFDQIMNSKKVSSDEAKNQSQPTTSNSTSDDKRKKPKKDKSKNKKNKKAVAGFL